MALLFVQWQLTYKSSSSEHNPYLVFDSLKKSTSNFLSDNSRENIIDVAKKIANLNSNQFRDIMNYTMINETNKKHVKERVK